MPHSIHRNKLPIDSPIRRAWESGNEDDIVVALSTPEDAMASATGREEAISDVLKATGSSKVRDAAALALADLNANNAVASIVEVLRRPGIAESAGTLLYALDELGASIPLDVLVTVVETGSYEARAEALFFAEEGRINLPWDPELLSRLEQLARQAGDSEEAEAASFALACLRSQAGRAD